MKKNGIVRVRENVVFLVITTILVLFIATCITLTVKGSESNQKSGYNEEYYDLLEERYKEEVTNVLSGYGMGQSGVNLTKITMEDGSREYALVIYNGKFIQMDSDRLEQLKNELCSITFPEASCIVRVSLREI